MKDVLGAFNQLQKAYRKYCYQAVAPLGIKMSEMLCVLYLYNFPDEDTAHAIAQYSQLSAGMVSKSLEACGKQAISAPKRMNRITESITFI